MRDRVKVLLNGVSSDSATSEHVLVGPAPIRPNPAPPAHLNPAPPDHNVAVQPQAGPVPPAHPDQALQVLTLAQRTAEEHVARAHQEADKIRADALTAAEQIARDAQAHERNVRRDADKVLTDARAAAEHIARESQARIEDARRAAAEIVADARQRAEQIMNEARSGAEHLDRQARQRYEDLVGSLGSKREALQQQIEALEEFDREYRARLTAFMQGQLRALWVEQPQITVELPDQPLIAPHVPPLASGGPLATAEPVAQASAGPGRGVEAGPRHGAEAGPRHGAEELDDAVPAQRQSPEADENGDEVEHSGN